jgi:thiol-disulfide isomerase/thioredoxin
VTLTELASQRPQLLVFLSITCGACVETMERMERWLPSLGPVQVAAVFTYELEKLPADYQWDGITRWEDLEGGATNTFARLGRPAAVLLGADGGVAGGPVAGGVAIERFVEDIVAELAAAAEDLPTEAR